MLKGSKKAFYKQFAEHGSGDALVRLEPKEVELLTTITSLDLHENREADWMDERILAVAKTGLYSIQSRDLGRIKNVTDEHAYEILQKAGVCDNNRPEYLYLKTLSALYRRRVKYWKILQTQSFPTVDQIGPRSLLEYGRCEDSLLFSWMSWRKLAFDLDNRSGQETGYLFEPILAACLGGVDLGARNSVVHRLDEQGNPLKEGRQIDCLVEETKTVYELKMRMTIAASGQGRFNEELSFPREAEAAGYKPVLVVFDPTPSSRLTELEEAYTAAGGESATGESAWSLLKNNAEDGMSIFIGKYVEPVLDAANGGIRPLPQNVILSASEQELSIGIPAGPTIRIPRQ